MSEERKNSVTQQAFWAMVQRDLLAQWRDKKEFIFRVGMLPLVLIVVYGYGCQPSGSCRRRFPPRCLRAWWG